MTTETSTSEIVFGQWLKHRRQSLDLTQDALAELVGCASPTIQKIERGEHRPSHEMAERLANALQLSEAERADFLRRARAQPTDSEPPRTLQLRRAPSVILVGRERERADLLRRLDDPNQRLITLTSPGGIGKTTLALQAAADLSAAFVDGDVFVPLAPIGGFSHVAATISDAIGVTLTGGRSPEEQVLAMLRERKMLLILDNLEHLLADRDGQLHDFLGTILRDAPGVRVLVTSRERLRLRNEHIFELGGLLCPNQTVEVDYSEAGQLFLARARQHDRDFALTPDNRVAVGRICHLLDGSPLAIELAAAWVRTLSPAEIAAELERGLDLLADDGRDADPRHRSMRSAIDHSWRLLSPDKQRVLAQMAVFRGGCTRGAAEVVAGATLPLLASLIDKSLLRRTPAGRYEIHELVRQFAASQLAADAAITAYNRHCSYYAAWIRSRLPSIQGANQQEGAAEIQCEIDNLRAAWDHAVAHRQTGPLWDMMCDGSALGWFFELRSWYHEAAARCQGAVDALRDLPLTSDIDRLLIAVLTGIQGWNHFRCGHPVRGIELLETSIATLRTIDYPLQLSVSLIQLGYIMSLRGEFERAVALQDEAVELAQSINSHWAIGIAYFLRGSTYAEYVPEIAFARFHEGLAFIRASGNQYVLGLTLSDLGRLMLGRGEVDQAEQAFRESLEVCSKIANGVGEVLARAGLAQVACARQDWRTAIEQCELALLRSDDVGDAWSRAKVLIALGQAHVGQNNQPAARRRYHEIIKIGFAGHILPPVIDALLNLASLDTHEQTANGTLLVLLAHIRRHSAASRSAAEQADQLWAQLAAQAEPHRLAEARKLALSLAPDDFKRLTMNYVEGRNNASFGPLGALPFNTRTPRPAPPVPPAHRR